MRNRVEYKVNSDRKAQQDKQYLCGPVSLKARITVHLDCLILETVSGCLYSTTRKASLTKDLQRACQSLPPSPVPTWFKRSAHRTRLSQNFPVVGVLLAKYGTQQRRHFQACSHHCEMRLLASLCLSVGKSLLSHGTARFSWDGFTSNLTYV